jgi:glycosyltransferase involved in cell wall biosynthesis
VPNLNTLPFLPERFRTIREQSFQDWELLVYDSYSDDGAWEYIRQQGLRDARIRAWQGPREGSPGSWNPCVREARGEYVYIATSDDTMPPDCLQKLVAALDEHPDCDVAHCRLRIIDENGHDRRDWWSEGSLFARSSGPLLSRKHIRKAPFDGLLHLLGDSVYISVTQLLIRRSLFDRIGLFKSTWGSVGDFNWSMKAGLVANTVHVPDTWGGWRVHPNQATATAKFGSADHVRRINEMIEDAFETCEPFLPPLVRRRVKSGWLKRLAEFRAFTRDIDQCQNDVSRRTLVIKRVLAGSVPALVHVKSSVLRTESWQEVFPEQIKRWLEQTGPGPVLVGNESGP